MPKKGEILDSHPDIMAWRRERVSFFNSECKNRRPQEIIEMLDKIFPPPDAWYDLQTSYREDRANGWERTTARAALRERQAAR